MGAYAVTLGQFRQFVEATHYATDGERNDAISSPPNSSRQGPGGYGYNAETGKLDEDRNPKHNWRNVGFPQTDDHPVTNVSWNDAIKFCEWLSDKEHKTYRLPTEAEWEYACRAGTTTRFWSGDNPESLVKIANSYDKSTERIQPEWAKFALKGDDGFEFTAPVGSFRPNAFGLYDMHGNVWQWVSDFYSPDTMPSRRSTIRKARRPAGSTFAAAAAGRPGHFTAGPRSATITRRRAGISILASAS